MKDKLAALKAHPTVAHALRAWTRYGNRLGSQFAAAITYFSVLAIVPIIMFAFSLLGMTVTTLRPELLGTITERITSMVGDAGAGSKISDLIAQYLRNWRGVGIVGLLSLFYAGSGWVGNMRGAVNAQWRPEFENEPEKSNFVVKILKNMGVLLLLLLGVLLTFALTFAGTALTDRVAGLLGMDSWPGGSLLLRIGSYLLTALAAWLLFLLIYTLFPKDHKLTKAVMKGAALAAVAFTVLQVGAGALFGVFAGNKAASLFGPVIVLMLFMNLFAQIILLVACWIATNQQPAVAFHHNDCDEPLRGRDDTVTAEDHWRLADEERAAQAAEKAPDDGDDEADGPGGATVGTRRHRTHTVSRPHRHEPTRRQNVLFDHPRPDPARMVSEPVAARSVRIGMASGWAVGAATGLGVGALVTSALSSLRRRLA